MPGIMVPSNIDTRKNILTLGDIINKKISAETKEIEIKGVVFGDTSEAATRNTAFAEDSDYREWLKTHNDPDEAVKEFVNKLPETVGHTEEVGGLVENLNRFVKLSAELKRGNEFSLTSEQVQEIKKDVDALLGEDGGRGFSEAVNDFNKATGYKYVYSPEIKTMLNMVKRTEKVAGELERLAVEEYNAKVLERTNEVDSIAKSVEDYNNDHTALRKDTEKQYPGLTADRFGEALGKLGTEAKQLDETIAARTAELDALRASLLSDENALTEQRNKLASDTSSLAQTEKNIKTASETLEKETADMYKNQAEANWLKAHNAAIEDEKRNNEILLKRDIQKLDSLIREDIRSTFFEKRNDWLACDQLKKEASFLGSLSKADAVKQFTPGGSTLADRFIELYDKAHPETEKNGLGKFLGMQPDGKKALQSLVNGFYKKADKGEFGTLLAAETEKLQSKLEADVKGLKQSNLSIKGYNRTLKEIEDNRHPELAAVMEKNTADRENYDHQKTNNEKMKNYLDQVLPNLEKAKERYENSIAEGGKTIAATEKSAAQKKESIALLEKELNENKKLLAERKKNIDDITALNERAAALDARRTKLGNYVNEFPEKNREFDVLRDPRTDRVQNRMKAFIARLDVNKKQGHNDSEEYKKLAEALERASSCKPEELREAVENVEKRAIAYVHAKGEARFFKRSLMGETRFNLATEIQGFCESLETSLAVPAASYNEAKTAEGNIRHIAAAGKTDMLFPAVFDPKTAAAKAAAKEAAKVNTAAPKTVSLSDKNVGQPSVRSAGLVK